MAAETDGPLVALCSAAVAEGLPVCCKVSLAAALAGSAVVTLNALDASALLTAVEVMLRTGGVMLSAGGAIFRSGGVMFRSGGVMFRAGGVILRAGGVMLTAGLTGTTVDLAMEPLIGVGCETTDGIWCAEEGLTWTLVLLTGVFVGRGFWTDALGLETGTVELTCLAG